MACWSVKAHLLGDDGKTSEIRRVSVPVSATYNQLYDKTKAVFPDLHNEEISLSWKDGDGDLVSFSSDAEMLEFTRTAEDEFLRIFIKVRAPKSNKSTPKTPTGAEWVVNPWIEKMSDLDSEEFSQSVLAGMRTVFQYIAGAETFHDKDRKIVDKSDVTNKEEREPSVCNNADHLHRDVTEVRGTRDTENQEADDVEKGDIETDDVERDEIETDDVVKDDIEKDDVVNDGIKTDDVETGHDSSEAPHPQEDVSESPNKIEEALEKLLAMGFHNEEGWLYRLIEEKEGRIDEVLESILPDENRAGRRNRNRMICFFCFRLISAEVCYQCTTCNQIICQNCKGTYGWLSIVHELMLKPTSAIAQKLPRWFDDRNTEEDWTKPSYMWTNLQKLFYGIYGAQSSSYQKHEASKPKSRDPVNRASPYPSCKNNRTKSHPETGGKPDIETDGPVTRDDSPKNGESWTLVEDDTSLVDTKADQNLEEGGSTQGGGAERKSHNARPTIPPIDPKIASALAEMMSMGFQNDDGWLLCLLQENNGNIEKVLDIIQGSDGKIYSK